jgi:hypothetical protein
MGGSPFHNHLRRRWFVCICVSVCCVLYLIASDFLPTRLRYTRPIVFQSNHEPSSHEAAGHGSFTTGSRTLLNLSRGQCRLAFPGLERDIDDAVRLGPFDLQPAGQLGPVQVRIRNGKVSIHMEKPVPFLLRTRLMFSAICASFRRGQDTPRAHRRKSFPEPPSDPHTRCLAVLGTNKTIVVPDSNTTPASSRHAHLARTAPGYHPIPRHPRPALWHRALVLAIGFSPAGFCSWPVASSSLSDLRHAALFVLGVGCPLRRFLRARGRSHRRR